MADVNPTTRKKSGSPNYIGTPNNANLPTAGEQPGQIWFEGQSIGQIPYAEWTDFETLSQADKEKYISEHFGTDVSGQMWGFAPATMITQQQIDQMGQRPTPTTTPTTTPTFGAGAGAEIPTPEVTPAPAYEISPEQQAFEDMYSGQLTDWVEAGGYGIPEETQAQMIQQQTDSLKAREQESIRVMRNNMERRGLMKMSSFEKAMGAASQFLGYLSEQSQLKYQPEFATWQAEQMAKMQAWQGKLDVYKMELNQAYQTQNMQLQARLQSQLNAEQHQFDLELAQMEIVTGLFTLGAAFL